MTRHAPSASSCEITITNPLGLHARPAAQFVKHALRFRAELWIIKDGQRYSASSLIEILRANLDQGSTAILEATGRDADEALASLCQLIREFKE
jgi:phosphocarrier protein HPr